jgi:pyruvate dehydrogenase E1 component alpha subunit
MTERRRILDPDGRLVEGAQPSMSADALAEALRWMLMSRAYDERATRMQRQGLYGVFSPALGQEASIVGSSMALDPAVDWIVPQYRELIALVRHGYPMANLAALGTGRNAEAARIPDGVNVLPTQVALAAQLPHAVGLAWGLKLQKKGGVVMAYVGDGGSSEGDFHEALNLAGVVHAPVVFFLQNNQWAISTPRRLQSSTPSFALRAAGYGFSGLEVDGNDLMAVHSAACEAVERARAGDGPTLIESVTYRMSFHNTTDNPSLYEDVAQRKDAARRDPIERVVKYLGWDASRDAQARAEAKAEVDSAFEAAASFPAVEEADLFKHVYQMPVQP